MVQDNRPIGRTFGTLRYVGDGDATEATLSSSDWTEIFSVQATKSLKYFPGHGVRSREGDGGVADFDFEATGGGSSNDGTSLNVEVRYAIYNDANKDDLAAVGPKLDSNQLRYAVGESIPDKVLVPSHGVGTPEDGYLVIEAKAKDSTADGAVIESDDSDHSGTLLDVGFPYTEAQIRG